MIKNIPQFKEMATVILNSLKNHDGVHAAVGNKIFPLVAPLNTKGDHISYMRDGVELTTSKMDGFAKFQVFFLVSIVSDDYLRALEISDEVFDALVGYHGGFKIEFKDLKESLYDQKFVLILQFSIR